MKRILLIISSAMLLLFSCSERSPAEAAAEITVIVRDPEGMKLIGPDFDDYSIDYCRVILESEGKTAADSGLIEGGSSFTARVIASERYTVKAYGYHSSDGTAEETALTELGYGKSSILPLEQGKEPVVVQLYADGATPPGDVSITLTLPESMTTYSYEFAYMYDIIYPDGRTLLHTPEWIIGDADNGQYTFTIPGKDLKPGRYSIIVSVMNNAYEAEASLVRMGMDALLLVAGESSSGTIDVRTGTAESDMAVIFVDGLGSEIALPDGLLEPDSISDGTLRFIRPETLADSAVIRAYVDGMEMELSAETIGNKDAYVISGLGTLGAGSHKLLLIAYDPQQPLSIGSASYLFEIASDEQYGTGTYVVSSYADLMKDISLPADELNLGFLDNDGNTVRFPARMIVEADGARPLHEILGLTPVNAPLLDYFTLSEDGTLERNAGTEISSEYSCIGFPEGVRKLGKGILQGEKCISSVYMPESLEEIGEDAFADSGFSSSNIAELPSLSDIGDGAFAGTSGLEAISFPESLESIGNAFGGSSVRKIDFSGCSRLEAVEITDVPSLGIFLAKDCSHLVSVSISGCPSFRHIQDNAFQGCVMLDSISLPDSIETIGTLAFSRCGRLSGLSFGSALSYIGKQAFADSGVTMLDFSACTLLEEIGERALEGIKQAEAIRLPESVEKIGDYAFEGCTSLAGLDLSSLTMLQEIGQYAFSGCSGLGGIKLPEGLRTIGKYAFYNCSAMLELALPSTVEEVGQYLLSGCSSLLSADFSACSSVSELQYVFRGCIALREAFLPGGISTINGLFNGCSALETLDISACKRISTIGNSVFYGCASLKKIVLPSTITRIGESAFSGCTSLEDINFQDLVNLDTIQSSAFYNCDSLKTLDLSMLESLSWPSSSLAGYGYSSIFSGCDSLETVILPEQVEILPPSLFSGCKSLKNIVMSSNLREMGSNIFSNTGFTELDLSGYEKLVSIPDSAFRECENLESIKLPGKLQKIGRSAFYECILLKEITLPSSVVFLGESAFRDCKALTKADFSNAEFSILGEYIDNNGESQINGCVFYGCETLNEVLLPETVKAIGNYSFYNCGSLKSIKLPAAVESISSYAFYRCQTLSMVDLSECVSLSSIGNSCFYSCPMLASVDLSATCIKEIPRLFSSGNGLKQIKLPDTVEIIAEDAFTGCSGIEQIDMPSSIKIISDSAFNNCDSLKEIDLSSCSELERIEDYAFNSCNALESVLFPETDTMEYISGFRYCEALESVDMSRLSGNVEIGPYAFYHCTSLSGIALSEHISSIMDYAFSNCTILSSIDMPEALESIGRYAFNYCQALTGMDLSGCGSLAEIGERAFYQCSEMGEIRIPSSVLTVGAYAVSYTKGPIIIDLDTRPAGWSPDWRRNYSGTVSWLPKE